MYDIEMNKIENALKSLALDESTFEKDTKADEQILDSYKEVIMDTQTDTKKSGWNIKKTFAVIGAVMAAALVVGALGIVGVFTPADKTAAYVAMEINPGVILEIDGQENVKAVAYANEEAKQLLAGIELTGSNSIDALGTICSLAQREGYLGDSLPNEISLTRFSDKNDKDQYYAEAKAKIEEVLGFAVNLNTQKGSLSEGSAYIKFKKDSPSPSDKAGETPEPTGVPSPTATPAPPPPSPSPTATPLPEADHAGTGDVMFDIYDTEAVADVTNDGTPDTISFTAGTSSSTLTVNGTDYTINQYKLAQKFAITDVDIDDGWLEIAFCDIDDPPEHDLDAPFTYYYWYDGSTFIECGSFWEMGWDGSYRAGFNANDHMDGHGMIMSVDRSPNFTDVWYMAHWTLDGSNRQKKEDLYATVPLNTIPPLTLDEPCLLLAHIDLDYFDTPYNSMWDYASWPHSDGRVVDPGGTGDVVIIAQPGETLQVVKVYGKRWFKLRTSDGYEGWIRVVNFEMSGYDDVMYIDAWIFSTTSSSQGKSAL